MVYVVDCHQDALMPSSEKWTWKLCERGRAVLYKRAPVAARLKNRAVDPSTFQPRRAKFGPGRKTAGIANVLDGAQGPEVILLEKLGHQTDIKARLDARRMLRRGRRYRETRYRKARSQNRQRKDDWCPPSLEARIEQAVPAVAKIRKLAPIMTLGAEHVQCDSQKLQTLEIRGVKYQQGTLAVYTVHLLEKWGCACVYGGGTDVPLGIEHLIPKSREGTNRITNLDLVCHLCNQAKAAQIAAEFVFLHVMAQAQKPRKNAALGHTTHERLYDQLKTIGLSDERGTEARWKMQRIQHDLPQEPYDDALCLAENTPDAFVALADYVQIWIAHGRATRQMCDTGQHGLSARHRSRRTQYVGFQTGNLIQAVVLRGEYARTWTGRVSIPGSGSFDTSIDGQKCAQAVLYRYCRTVQRNDGWPCEQKPRAV
jgi:hypothetical protein